MGIALVVIGFLALLAAVPVGVVALVQRVRSRPAKRTGTTAGGLAAGAVALMVIGGIVGVPTTTPRTDQAADATSPSPAATTTGPPTVLATAATTAPTATATSAAPVVATTTPRATTPTTPAPTAVPPAPTAPPPPTSAPARPAGQAAAAAAALAVKGRAPATGYSRDAFGPAWADIDANGCDTRDDVLRRDLTGVRTVAGTGGCQIATGTLHDPYSGTTIAFTRGESTSTAVQIDHVVALSDAWQTGAFQWSPIRREAFANDPLNLLAVKGSLNEAKGDGDAATWLPPNKAIRCAYVARQVAVKTAYSLWATPAEAAATTRILTGCPGQTLPTETGTTPPRIDPAAPVAAPAPARTPVSAPTRATRRPSPPPVRTTPRPKPRHTATPVAPGGGATALCRDGSYSYAAHHQGACSHHGGVAQFYR